MSNLFNTVSNDGERSKTHMRNVKNYFDLPRRRYISIRLLFLLSINHFFFLLNFSIFSTFSIFFSFSKIMLRTVRIAYLEQYGFPARRYIIWNVFLDSRQRGRFFFFLSFLFINSVISDTIIVLSTVFKTARTDNRSNIVPLVLLLHK